MEFRLSMVHHNPGEKPFVSKFSNPKTLLEYGFNGQVFKHINTVITFDKLGHNLFPINSPEREWLEKFRKNLRKEIIAAKEQGLMVYHHIDLFVLPKKIVEIYKDQICDDKGKISIDKKMTLELHKILLDEMFEIAPEIDGLIIRVGETYLYDTPFHTGNGAVQYGNINQEKSQFVKLINFLREEVCVKRDKKIFFRTWDCFNNRFHTNLQYYLDITNQVEEHKNLLFSIKYTSLDFWRRVNNNECLTKGKHNQIIEVQSQREYEGKGAFPSYGMNDVINGDKYLENPIPLKEMVKNPLIKGIYVWPRGGGWYGPYLSDEFWCDLNTYVIANYAKNTSLSEEEIFNDFIKKNLYLSDSDCEKFRELCLMSNDALLYCRYIRDYDKVLKGSSTPCCNWMRDDCLGGLRQLTPAFDVLFEEGKLNDALEEKAEGLSMWEKVYNLCKEIKWNDCEKSNFIIGSCEYAVKLFKAVYNGWKIMVYGYLSEKGMHVSNELKTAIIDFDVMWAEYQKLNENDNISSLYRLKHLSEPGLGETIEKYRSATF